MSSSAFFIEAAANTVRPLSCAGQARYRGRSRPQQFPARRCIVALHREFEGPRFRARQSGVSWVKDATGGSAVPSIPWTYDRPDIASRDFNSLRGPVKSSFGYSVSGASMVVLVAAAVAAQFRIFEHL